MAEEATEQTTLHDTLTATFDTVIPPGDPAPVVDAPATQVAEALSDATETAEAKIARERDEKGRFAAKPAESATAPATATKPADATAVASAPVAEPAKSQRPSSWKKEHWEAFDKLATENPAIAQYILQRETEAARGVSAYKAEWDKAKPILDAVTPHLPLFQQHGIDPGQQIGKYVAMHKDLSFGNEEQKLSVLMRLAQDYKIPVEKMFVQQDGKIFFNPQVGQAAPQQQPQQQAFNPQAIEATVQNVLMRERTQASIADMEKDQARFPHFSTVRNTMGQLISAGVASPDDLPGAYDAALALPQHRELLASQQSQQAAQAESDRKARAVADTQRAKAAAVSPKSATPASGPVKASKGLRESLTEAVEAVGSSRV